MTTTPTTDPVVIMPEKPSEEALKFLNYLTTESLLKSGEEAYRCLREILLLDQTKGPKNVLAVHEDPPKSFIQAVRDGEVANVSIDPDNPLFHWDWMTLTERAGTKVWFTGMNGWTGEVAQAIEAGLRVGHQYTVKYIEVGSMSSTVVLEEFPTRQFNTTHFAKSYIGPEDKKPPEFDDVDISQEVNL